MCARHGVNRLSIGVQSFEGLLRRMNRSHDAAQIEAAIARARAHYRGLSIDLIYGLPGRALDMWLADLQKAAALPMRTSLYSLTIEENSAFGRMGVLAADDDWNIRCTQRRSMICAHMASFSMKWQTLLGIRRYRHNLVYWHYEDFHGIGCGASVGAHRAVTTTPFLQLSEGPL
ncbi:MAG: hypothetical protein ACLVJ6_15740 [Merdibacter sp.]